MQILITYACTRALCVPIEIMPTYYHGDLVVNIVLTLLNLNQYLPVELVESQLVFNMHAFIHTVKLARSSVFEQLYGSDVNQLLK